MEPRLSELEAAPPDKRRPRTVALPDGATGYVEPLVAAPLCLQCHGDTIAPEVRPAILAKYPTDKAVDFRTGDLRGVVWVERRAAAKGVAPADDPVR